MKHSQSVQEAIQKAFKELFALEPRELRERLKNRKTGPIGYLMRETGSIDYSYEHYLYRDDAYSLKHSENDIHGYSPIIEDTSVYIPYEVDDSPAIISCITDDTQSYSQIVEDTSVYIPSEIFSSPLSLSYSAESIQHLKQGEHDGFKTIRKEENEWLKAA